MSIYFAHVLNITPVLANDNFALEAASGESGRIKELRFSSNATGGGGTSMLTRFGRTNGAGAGPTSGDVQPRHPNSVANVINFISAWSSQPVLDAGALLAEEWVSNGGVVRWLAGPDEELVIIGPEQLSCRNQAGLVASTYRAVWDED